MILEDKTSDLILGHKVVEGPFFLFAYDDQYPAGGLGDYQETFVSIADALDYVRNQDSHYENIELVAVIDGKLEWIGDINPTGNVHFEPAGKILERLMT